MSQYIMCSSNITSWFLISSYGTPLDQRASYLPLHNSPDSIVNYDYR